MDRKEIAEQFYMEEHAVLYALLVKAARELYGDKGELANVEGTIQHGRERGRRMPCAHSRTGKTSPQKTTCYTASGWTTGSGAKRMSMPSPLHSPPTAPTAAGVKAGKNMACWSTATCIVPTSTSI